ncbi:MAG: Rhomboid protease GlpG [candidate division BRC1 bacterium ADurb.BinA364]|nr:MAG: Rhomboid protease GlpG [candidate division BRC1 bacterium ADurb.BinA364]
MRRFLQFAPQVYATTLATAAAVAIWMGLNLGQMALGRPIPPEALGRGAAELYWQGQLWRLPLNTLHHDSFFHLFFNLYWIWLLGAPCELALGTARYAAFLLGAAAATTAASETFYEPNAIGLSGVVYAVFGLMLFLRKRNMLCASAMRPATVNILLIWLGLCVPLTLAGALPVANVAHFSGLGYGLAAGWAFDRPFRLSRKSWRRILASPIGAQAQIAPFARRALFFAAHLLLIPAWLAIANPEDNAYYHFDRALASTDASEEAIAHYRRALELRPNFPEARINLALSLLLARDYEGAIEQYDAFLAARSLPPQLEKFVGIALVNKARAQMALGRMDEAMDTIRRLEQADPDMAREAQSYFRSIGGMSKRLEDAISSVFGQPAADEKSE